jgi:L-iditol 2-dehydrogenase
MRALVIHKPHHMELVDMDQQQIGSQDVLIRSMAMGVCKTDMEIYQGFISSDFVTYPVVPGHEWSGVVVKTGDSVTHVREGDRVISEGLQPCGRCEDCRQGSTNLCAHYDQLGFTRYGGAAEFVCTPAKGVHQIPDSLSFEAAVLVEPAACVMHGFMRARLEPGITAVVVGPGTLGLIAVQLFKAYGAGKVILMGTREEQLSFGRELGADITINIREINNPVEMLMQLTGGRGADIVMETAGSVDAVRMSMDLCRTGGQLILEGVAGEGRQLTIPSDYLLLRDLTVHGIFSYTSKAWSKVLQLLDAGKLHFEPIVTHRYPIDQYQEAFQMMQERKGKIGKVVLLHRGVGI